MASSLFSNFNISSSTKAFKTISSRTSPQSAIQVSRTQQRSRPFQHFQRRTASYGRGRGFNYQRFQQSRNLFKSWAARPTFYYEVGGIGAACGAFYILNLEEVPVSGRRRFNVISPATEASTGAVMYNQTMQLYQDKILSPMSPQHRMVQRVLDRLIPHSGLSDETNKWEVHVIKDPQQNAFVIPGGKVFVFSGILDVCQGEDGLAAVLGHEIAQ